MSSVDRWTGWNPFDRHYVPASKNKNERGPRLKLIRASFFDSRGTRSLPVHWLSHWKTHVQSTAMFDVSDCSFNRSKISERIWCHRSFFVVLWEVFRYNFGIHLARSRVIVENSTIRLFVNFKNGSDYSQTTITSEGIVDLVDVCFRDRRRFRTFIVFFQISSHFEYTMSIFTEF